MKRSRLWASLLGIVFVSASLLVLNLSLGNTPVLGLDLRGGVSVILASTEGAGDEDLIVIRDLIRDELEQRGIAEPDVRVEGSNVIVDLPGVKDQQDALDAVDIAGIVSLRPVLQCARHQRHVDHGRRRRTLRPDVRRPATTHRRPPTTAPGDAVGRSADARQAARPTPRRPDVPTGHAPSPARATTTRAGPRSERPGGARATGGPAVRGDAGEVCIVGPSGGIGRGVRARERRAVARSGRRLGGDREPPQRR